MRVFVCPAALCCGVFLWSTMKKKQSQPARKLADIAALLKAVYPYVRLAARIWLSLHSHQ